MRHRLVAVLATVAAVAVVHPVTGAPRGRTYRPPYVDAAGAQEVRCAPTSQCAARGLAARTGRMSAVASVAESSLTATEDRARASGAVLVGAYPVRGGARADGLLHALRERGELVVVDRTAFARPAYARYHLGA